MTTAPALPRLRPGVTNPNAWQSADRKRAAPESVRKQVLARDDFTCASCGHRALKDMHIHHLHDPQNDDLDNLTTLCVACHAVLHFGQSMQFGALEIWKAPLTQLEIVRVTREGIRGGLSLQEVNKTFGLKRGKRAPDSLEWANDLVLNMGSDPRAELPEPLCAVFVKFKKWQIEA